MASNIPLLPKEVIALVHHVELNRAGWWDKAVNRLILAAIWLSGCRSSIDEIQRNIKREFQLSLNTRRLLLSLKALESQHLLVQLPDGSFRIPDEQREVFERDIAEAEKAMSDAKSVFFQFVRDLCIGVDAQIVWDTFESDFLAPLIKEVGANTYHLIAGNRMILDKDLIERFLGKFKPPLHPKLNQLVSTFLDPKKEEVRAYVSRMLHARFCVEASGLTEDVIQKLRDNVGKPVRFRIFVDTNFLFSLLELHENPSNAAARELHGLIVQLKSNPEIKLFITLRTIDEAKETISLAKSDLSEVSTGSNFTQAALEVGFSGMKARFLYERQRRGGALTAQDWFDPYLNDFLSIARNKGVELFNERLDSYGTRQDVIDDIDLVMKSEEGLANQRRRKSYMSVAHDMILWHFVRDKRPAYIESPTDAEYWILTVDFRLIGFDEQKQIKTGAKIPLCLHPTSLIQFLQFWVPRTKDFEEAMIGSLRFPFLLQKFDAEAEQISLKILKGLSRFEYADDIPKQVITRVILNQGLRSRLKPGQIEDVEITLIRNALIKEITTRTESETRKVQELQKIVKMREDNLSQLKATLATQDEKISRLQARWESVVEGKKRRQALLEYFLLLAGIVILSGAVAWRIDSLSPGLARITGSIPIKIFAAVLVFIVGHFLLEWQVGGRQYFVQLWPFEQIKRFRKWLWVIVMLTFLIGVIGNLYANRIQKNLDLKLHPSATLYITFAAVSDFRIP